MLKVTLSGRLTQEPELKTTTNGTTVCELNVAANNRGDDERTSFLTIVTFGTVAENVSKYLAKGSRIVASGELQVETFTRQDGSKGASAKVYNADVEFVDTKKKEGGDEKKDAPTVDERAELPY